MEGELSDASGKPQPEDARRRLNDVANRRLAANVRRHGLSIVPVVGAGQEEGEDGTLTANREDSFLILPVGKMDEEDFAAHIKDILFNPTGLPGRGPYPHTQWGGRVKLPSQPRAFILHQEGDPTGPEDYRIGDHLGTTARPRKIEPYCPWHEAMQGIGSGRYDGFHNGVQQPESLHAWSKASLPADRSP